MPIYEYRCRQCQDEFETLVRNARDEEQIECPQCGSTELERVLSLCARGAGHTQSSGCQPRSTGFS